MSERGSSRVPMANEFVSLREAMDRLLADSFVGGPFRNIWSAAGGEGRTALPLDVYATKDEAVVIAAVPGLGPNDIEITLDQGTLTISGTVHNVAASEEGKGATWYLHELQYGTFRRSVSLPFEVDANAVEATFENGILRLRLPKVEQAKPKQIKVRVSDAAPAAVGAESGAGGANGSEG